MANLNEMRELKNIVDHIISDPELAKDIMSEANKLLDMKLHNAGLDAIRGNYNSKDIQEARAAYYLQDLIHAVIIYMEDGNSSTITMNDELYPNAEKPDWAAEED